MQRNNQCIKDILSALASCEYLNGSTTITFPSYEDVRTELHLEQYTADTIEYHLRQCDMAGFLVGARFGIDGYFVIKDLTPAAHSVLEG